MTPPPRELKTWRTELQTQLAEAIGRVAELQSIESSLTRQIKLIDELLGATQPERFQFRTELRDILSDHLPHRLTEIRAALAERTIEVPGRGTDANLIAHLVRVEGVSRVARGTYQVLPPGTPRASSVSKKRRKKTKTRTPQQPAKAPRIAQIQ